MNFQSGEMDTQSSADFWYDVVGSADDEDSNFEGFTEDDVVRINPADAETSESDLDIDFEAVEDGTGAEDSDSDTDIQMRTFLTLNFLFAFIFE